MNKINTVYGFNGKFIRHVNHWVYYSYNWDEPSVRVQDSVHAIRLWLNIY